MFLYFLCALCSYTFVVVFSYGLGYQCEREHDFDSILLPTSDHLESPYHKDILKTLNDKLREKCDKYYDFSYVNLASKPSFYYPWPLRRDYDSNEDLQHILDWDRISYINLFDLHYYEKKFEKEQSFVYAGDINVYGDKTEAYVNVANFTLNTTEANSTLKTTEANFTLNTNATDPKNNNNTTEYENESKDVWKKERVNDTQAAKFVTKPVESKHNDLLNFITSIQYHSENNITTRASCKPFTTEPAELKYVLICSNNMVCFASNPYSRKLKFIFKHTNECKESMETFDGTLLAVIAPEPFRMSHETRVPAIFYTSFSESEYEAQFPNSLNLVSEEQYLLKHAFLKFIRRFGWRRVAIISDFAPNSMIFEKELTELFYEEGILHKVEYADEEEEFKQAIQKLHDVNTRIVIANVDEKNAVKLARMPEADQSGFVFIFRVPPVWGYSKEKFISISLGVANAKHHACQIYGEFKPICSGILEGLRIVSAAHSNFQDKTKTSIKDFYRKFKEYMKTLLENKYEVTVARSLSSVISTMSYGEKSDILNKDVHDSEPIFNQAIYAEKSCSYKSNNFDKPCDPMPLLYIMLVVMMFAILVLILTCYFHNTSPLNSKTYEQL